MKVIVEKNDPYFEYEVFPSDGDDSVEISAELFEAFQAAKAAWKEVQKKISAELKNQR